MVQVKTMPGSMRIAHLEVTMEEMELLHSGLQMLLHSFTRHEHMDDKIHALLKKIEAHS
ncbi:MAG: hypothetical protein HW403_225 [Dehalococcoidia bacterium]|nr:hypothetical protein [Dehalococcoidia bacterium]